MRMNNKESLLKKLFQKEIPRNFTVKELEKLLRECNCTKHQCGRCSGIRFYHDSTKRVLAFDEPHPGNNLMIYQIKKIRQFLKDIGEYKEE